MSHQRSETAGHFGEITSDVRRSRLVLPKDKNADVICFWSCDSALTLVHRRDPPPPMNGDFDGLFSPSWVAIAVTLMATSAVSAPEHWVPVGWM